MKHTLNKNIIAKASGLTTLATGFLMLLSLPVALYYGDKTIVSILISSLICIVFGSILLMLGRKQNFNKTSIIDVFAIVSLTWLFLGIFGSLPFLLSGSIQSFTDAVFESVSGFTTTGASILRDIESNPKSILFWRSLTQWIGGMGILVLVIAVLPFLGVGEVKLYVAEVSGSESNKLHPKIKSTARSLWIMYTFLTLLQTVLLVLAGQSFFEAICHSFTTLSTGGFSPNNSSIINYSPLIQIIIIVFMFIGGMNFSLHFALFRGNFKKIVRNEELISFFSLIFFISLAIALYNFYDKSFSTVSQSFLHAVFQVVSIITTTGFVSTNYDLWNIFPLLLLFSMFFIGGMIGSTAGGIKFTRFFILFKNLKVQLKGIIHSNAVFTLRTNGNPIPKHVVRNVFGVFIAYVFIFCIGSLALSFFISDIKEVLSVTMACLGAIGPALGDFGAVGNYADLHPIGKWICVVLMILGRLEVVSVLAIVYYLFFKRF